VEVKHRVIVYRVIETLKGVYDPTDYPNQYKGYFTDYTPTKYYRPTHTEEVWFLGQSKVLYTSDSSHQRDPSAFYPFTVFYDRLQLPVTHGKIEFPIEERPYRHETTKTQRYSRDEFLQAVRRATAGAGASSFKPDMVPTLSSQWPNSRCSERSQFQPFPLRRERPQAN
jgi:hypothetical protein